MGKPITDLIIPAALGATGFGLAGMGPLAGLAGATEGAGLAAGAALPALDVAGAAIAPEAAGLLGGGAFGSADMIAANTLGSGLGGVAFGGAGAPSLANFGPNGEFVGSTIESAGLTPNAYTGGYDALNGLQRFGQRASGLLDGALSGNSGGLNAAKAGMQLLGGQEQPQAPKNVVSNVSAPPRQSPSSPGSFTDASNMTRMYPNYGVQQQLLEQERLRQMSQLYPNYNFRG